MNGKPDIIGHLRRVADRQTLITALVELVQNSGVDAKIPKKAVLDMAARKLYIDDVEFPWEMDATGPILANRGGGICTVTMSFFVDAIEVLPIPEGKPTAVLEAELRVAAANQALAKAMSGDDPLGIHDAQRKLYEANAELAQHKR